MRKKILSGVFALGLLATVGFGVNKSMKSDAHLSDLALSNVEALAGDETVSGYVICTGSGSLYCYLTNKSEYKEITIRQ